MLRSLFAVLLIAFTAFVWAVDEKYVVSGFKEYVVDGSGECVIDGFHSPDYTKVEACGDIIAKPVVVTPPPAPVTRTIRRTVTFDAETLFGFDRSDLTPQGQASLDNFISEINSYSNLFGIEVVGHTDRIGSEAYNQKLSEERASTVANYLVSRGVPSSSVFATGRGETQPTPDTAGCASTHGNALIACLQPDRRVEINVDAEVIETITVR